MSGSVSNPTGSVKGHSLAGLLDAYTGNWGGLNGSYSGSTSPIGTTRAQAQHVVLLSDSTGACGREGSHGNGSYAPSELTLRFTMIVYADVPNSVTTIPPAADLPLTFAANTWLTTSDGAHRVANPYFMQAKSSGSAGGDTAATAGTVIFTQADGSAYAGSYDLWFGSDHVAGSFVAPWC